MSIARKVKRAGAAKAKPNGEMVFIPAGELTMGSDRHYDEERPTHRVMLSRSTLRPAISAPPHPTPPPDQIARDNVR